MRIPRFRLRTLMFAVAVVGLDLAYWAWAVEGSRKRHCCSDPLEGVILDLNQAYPEGIDRTE